MEIWNKNCIAGCILAFWKSCAFKKAVPKKQKLK